MATGSCVPLVLVTLLARVALSQDTYCYRLYRDQGGRPGAPATQSTIPFKDPQDPLACNANPAAFNWNGYPDYSFFGCKQRSFGSLTATPKVCVTETLDDSRYSVVGLNLQVMCWAEGSALCFAQSWWVPAPSGNGGSYTSRPLCSAPGETFAVPIWQAGTNVGFDGVYRVWLMAQRGACAAPQPSSTAETLAAAPVCSLPAPSMAQQRGGPLAVRLLDCYRIGAQQFSGGSASTGLSCSDPPIAAVTLSPGAAPIKVATRNQYAVVLALIDGKVYISYAHATEDTRQPVCRQASGAAAFNAEYYIGVTGNCGSSSCSTRTQSFRVEF